MDLNKISSSAKDEACEHLKQLWHQYNSYSVADVHEMIGIDPTAAKVVADLLAEATLVLLKNKENTNE
jgi:hypothetical protein